MASPDENVSSGELRGLSAALRGEKERETEVRRDVKGGLNEQTRVPCGKKNAHSVPTVTHRLLPNISSWSVEELAETSFFSGPGIVFPSSPVFIWSWLQKQSSIPACLCSTTCQFVA